jgi:hypothetical protein
MPSSGRNVNVAAGLKPYRLGLAFKKQPCRPGEQKDPLGDPIDQNTSGLSWLAGRESMGPVLDAYLLVS